MVQKARWLTAAILLCGMQAGVGSATGMRVQPGGALVQGVPVGERRRLPTPLVIFNDDDRPCTMSVTAIRPSVVGSRPPRGYTEIPDPGWLTFKPAKVTVPPRSQAAVQMFLQVPGDDKFLNQHWSVSLAVRGRAGKRRQIGLAVYPRFEIETRAAPGRAQPDGAFVIAPSLVRFEAVRPGSTTPAVTLRVWNNTAAARQCRVQVHGRSVPAKKPVVALSNGQSWIPDVSWVRVKKDSFEVAAGSVAEVAVQVAVPEGKAYRGGAWEAVVLITAEDKSEAFARIRITTLAE